jgi:RIO kinase 1
MKTPAQFISLVQEGLIDEVLLQLMSGKEASVFVVISQGKLCCAKVYKDANQRNFKHKSQYTEGRRVRDSRRSRAMGKNSRYGRREQEDAWQNSEVEALCHLSSVGVRVPQVLGFYDGILLMELVTDDEGGVAPQLHQVELTPDQARQYFLQMVSEIVRMLCAGIIHGDLSEYNILFHKNGPVIIDLPQAVNASANNNASQILERDVCNVRNYFGRFAPELLETNYGREIWEIYKKGKLTPETKLTGRVAESTKKVDVRSVMQAIDDARDEEFERR